MEFVNANILHTKNVIIFRKQFCLIRFGQRIIHVACVTKDTIDINMMFFVEQTVINITSRDLTLDERHV